MLCICHRFGARSLLREFMTMEDLAVFSFGLWYHKLQYLDVEDDDKGYFQEIRVDSYVTLMLPMLSKGTEAFERYALVTSNWRTWDDSGNVVQPYMCSQSTL
jgi:hypothetical protein